MARDIEVIDADGHITESDEQLKQYMETPWVTGRRPLYPIDNWTVQSEGPWGPRRVTRRQWLNAMDEGGLTTAYCTRPVVLRHRPGSASRTWRWPCARPGTTSSPRSS